MYVSAGQLSTQLPQDLYLNSVALSQSQKARLGAEAGVNFTLVHGHSVITSVIQVRKTLLMVYKSAQLLQPNKSVTIWRSVHPLVQVSLSSFTI